MSSDTSLTSKILTALCEAGDQMRFDVAQILAFALDIATAEDQDSEAPTALQVVAEIYAHLHALQHEGDARRYPALALAA